MSSFSGGWSVSLFLLLFALLPPIASSKKDCSQTDKCWSPWSPCTVTCRERGEEGNQFVKKWRYWGCEHCANVTQPKEKAEFAHCDYRVPFCMWQEKVISNRTVTRLTVLTIATFLIVIPTLVICCRYSPGYPLLCCLRRRKGRRKLEEGQDSKKWKPETNK